MDKQCANEEEEEAMDEDSENSQLLRLMARHTQLKDLLHAHHIIGTHKLLYYFVFSWHSPIYYRFDNEMYSSLVYLSPLMSLRWVQRHQDPSRQRSVRVCVYGLRGRLLRDLQPGDGPETNAEDQPSQHSPIHSFKQPG